MEKFYFNQLEEFYPEKVEILNWLKDELDERIYYYGPNFKYPHDIKQQLRSKFDLSNVFRFIKYAYFKVSINYKGAIISNAYFNVGNKISEMGYKVLSPPWVTGGLSQNGLKTICLFGQSDFNYFLSDEFEKKIKALRDELREFLINNKTPFVLLSNDVAPIHRLIIDICREIGTPTGVFLHGLPACYNAVDGSRADYLFVWGEKIKDNFVRYGAKTNIVVTGHPSFSCYKSEHNASRDIIVLSQAISGSQSQSDRYQIEDRGLSVQYIYSVEKVLKKMGYTKAVLRVHPSENPMWYEEIMDKSFYMIDKRPLKETLCYANFIVGPISTVILDAVYSEIPYYSFIIDPKTNPNAYEIVPPFNNISFPASFSEDILEDNIRKNNYVKKEHFDGYINSEFDISKIVSLVKNIENIV